MHARASSASPAPMGTEVLRPHDCLARARVHAHARRPLRPAAGRKAPPPRHGGARGDHRRASAAATAPREARVKAAADAYAGPAFGAMSPSPRALPLPRFPLRTAAAAAENAPGVDDSATRELRRLLGLQ